MQKNIQSSNSDTRSANMSGIIIPLNIKQFRKISGRHQQVCELIVELDP